MQAEDDKVVITMERAQADNQKRVGMTSRHIYLFTEEFPAKENGIPNSSKQWSYRRNIYQKNFSLHRKSWLPWASDQAVIKSCIPIFNPCSFDGVEYDLWV